MKQFTIIFITFFFPALLYAQQSEKINCQPLSNEQGLSQSSVLTIHQDIYGFMWLGTRDGLNLYDGSKIQIYKNIPGDQYSLSGNLVNDITNADNGNLWIAHNNGVSFFDRLSGKFKNYAIEAANSEIRSLLIINKTILACGWSGLFVLDQSKDMFIPFKPAAPGVRMPFSISKIVPSPQGTYWIASTNNGLFHLDIKTKKISKVFSSKHIEYGDTRIEDILFHPNGKAYIGTYGKGLLECDLEGNILRKWESGSPDIMLPGMNGKDFCAEVKSNILTSHIPVLLLTAIHEEESKIEGLELGADDYLTKPFIFKELFYVFIIF